MMNNTLIKSKIICFLLLFLGVFFSNRAFCEDHLYIGVGFDNQSTQVSSAFIFYPSNSKNTSTKFGDLDIDASQHLPIAGKDKQYPLIILSHGTGAGSLAHHNLVTQLTKYGFIVVTLTHSDDNFRNLFYHTKNIYTRVAEISTLIDQLKNSHFSKNIDFNNINFIGYSAGGTTGLFLSGGKFSFDNYNQYLNHHHECPMNAARRAMPENLSEINKIKKDPRIKKFILIAPASFLFSAESIKNIKSPILIIGGEKDEILAPKDNFIDLSKKLTNDHKLILIPNAGHYAFLAPCSQESMKSASLKKLCGDSSSRSQIAKKIVKEINDFL